VTITVLLADDQQLMRTALRTCLDPEPDLEIIGEAADGAEAVRMAQRLRPDVVVMDVRMPILDGIGAIRRIVALGGDPPVRMLVMTTFDLDEYIIDALRAGASGFLLKDATPDELIHAIRVIAAGQAFLAPTVTRRLLDLRGSSLPPLPTGECDPALAGLTARELTVLKLVARGMSNAAIAVEMDLALSSVKSHVGHLLTKLGFDARVQLAAFAYEHGLVRPGCQDDPVGNIPSHPPGRAPDARPRTRPPGHRAGAPECEDSDAEPEGA
jgi:DNA-binding NarL/FixJ family response regulator